MSSKIVFITGATSGIGAACAHIFASHGYNLILNARKAVALEELRLRLQSQYNIAVHTVCFDVRDRKTAKEAISNLPPEFASIDILINNAGLALGIDKEYEGKTSICKVNVDEKNKIKYAQEVRSANHIMLDNEKEILLYTMQSACMSFDWTIRQFYHSEWKSMGGGVYDLVAEELESVGPGSNGLLAAPWLHGERPPLSEKARGLFLNIDASHERKHFVSAMQESICYMLRMKLEKYAKETGKTSTIYGRIRPKQYCHDTNGTAKYGLYVKHHAEMRIYLHQFRMVAFSG